MLRALTVCALISSGLVAQRDSRPLTRVEQSGFTATSTLEDVRSFLESLADLEHGDRLQMSTFGRSKEGRDLLLVRAGLAGRDAPPLRILVLANIHGGEVCGKEAVQLLMREIAMGEHADVLENCDLYFAPIYNVDGNEKIATSNRSNVNGPTGGLGERANAEGFDLNRDCIKAESPECQALLGLFNRTDPHVLMDLHTTNGSPHGWHLTYAPSLCTNVDPALDSFARTTLLPEVRGTVAARHSFRIYDYGNFSRRGGRSYRTFDHRPRFTTNYYGLRNRIAVLSEAYAYDPFEIRVRSTRAFVLETLRSAALKHSQEILDTCRAADERARRGDAEFGWETDYVDGFEDEVAVGTWDPVRLPSGATRMTRRSEISYERMPVQVAFRSGKTAALPAGWAIEAPSQAVIANLTAHGVRFARLVGPTVVATTRFIPESGDKARRNFQGHREITLRGSWVEVEETLPADTLIVSSRQRLARLAAQLLEPQSEDGLTTWNAFEKQTEIGADGSFPVRRLSSLDGLRIGQ